MMKDTGAKSLPDDLRGQGKRAPMPRWLDPMLATHDLSPQDIGRESPA